MTLEPHGRADHRTVYDVVPFKSGSAGALRKICRQSTKSNVAIDRDTVDLTERRVVGGNCLPRKLTTGAEATNVATEHELLPSRQLLPKTRADKRVDPIDGAGFRNRATSG